MEKYANKIPLVMRNAIKALDNEFRQGIMLYLEKNAPKSFMDISNDLIIPKNKLSHHIKILMRYGLLYNFYNKNEFDDKFSFYELSKIGKRFIQTLLNYEMTSEIIGKENPKILNIDDNRKIRDNVC